MSPLCFRKVVKCVLEVYWGLFIAGIALVIITIIFGEILDGFLDGIFEFLSIEGLAFVHPMTFVGGLTILGGAGILITPRTDWGHLSVFVLALSITLVANVILYFIYICPMQRAENSTSYSIQDLIGKIGEVSVSIPNDGYGEVIVRSGAGK